MRARRLSKKEAYARYEAGTIRWSECEAIEREPGRLSGAWRFKGTDVPLANLFHTLAAGSSAADFIQANDGVEESGPSTVLEFLAQQLDEAKEALWRYGGPRTASPPLLDGGERNRDAGDDPGATYWKNSGAVSRDAERMTGSWVIEHQRFPLSILFGELAAMERVDEFLEIYSVPRDKTLPVLQFLADDLDRVHHDTPAPAPAVPDGEK